MLGLIANDGGIVTSTVRGSIAIYITGIGVPAVDFGVITRRGVIANNVFTECCKWEEEQED